MDAGYQMLYPAQVVDGLVHQHGGSELREALNAAPVLEHRADGDHVRCRLGDVMLTSAPAALSALFDIICHTPPPFYNQSSAKQQCAANQWASQLASCYIASLRSSVRAAANAGSNELVVATPILGAGARGAPTKEAARVLVRAFRSPQASEIVVTQMREVVIRVVLADAQSESDFLAEMVDSPPAR